ncbi:retinal dehydrogenase 1-like [Leptopilina heterotoma]|uniref:retinal dehydrogenase 1-like n=1 Tax=Leptopilina heterotoma TaxID=63436 RepID=UPI001CA889BC|nr:retinal dehydrogenase 1-like [Leptopilina heterotoma]
MTDFKPITNPSIQYTKIFINNEWHNSVSGKKFPVINPSNEKVIADVAEGDKADIDKAVSAAREAFSRGSLWRQMDASARGVIINKLADLMDKNVNELASIQSVENGKPFSNSVDEVIRSAKLLRYFAGCADKIHGSTLPADGDVFAMTRKEPVGVVGSIIPWNYPITMVGMKIGPALATGCTMVMKPAEQTPLTALYIANLAKEAGLPKGVLNVVPGYGITAGSALAEHPDVNKIAFTGSVNIGRKIIEASAKSNLKRVTLELGGKSPLVVFEDADLELAATYTSLAFLNAGQICLAPTRVYVQSGVYDKFVDMIVKRATNLKVGGPFETDSFYGSQIDDRIFKRVMSYIELGKKEGAKLETGGHRHGKLGFFVQPTVFSNVKDSMTIAKEEIFGPVQSLLKFDTLEEVIARANNTTYGLVAGVFTKNIDQALEFSKAVEAGTVWVNQWFNLSAQTPFGGYKQSGIGREIGIDSLDHYMEVKTINIKLPTNH